MESKTMRWTLLGALLVVVSAASATAAESDDGRWRLRVGLVAMDSPSTSVDVGGPGAHVSVDTEVGGGLGVDLEYRVSDRLGIDVGVLSAAPSIGAHIDIGHGRVRLASGVTVTPITAGLNVHLTPGSRADVYVGPLLAYITYSGAEITIGPGVEQSVGGSHDAGIGANLGVDVGLGNGRWSLGGSLRYIQTADTAPGEHGSLGFDPVILSVGFGYRF